MENNIQSALTEQELDLRLILSRYINRWYFFAISLIIALGGAFVYHKVTPKVYEVSSVILIKDEQKGLTAGNDILKDLTAFGGNKIVENEMEIFRARSLMKKVIEALKLNIQYKIENSPIDIDLYGKSPIWIHYTELYSPVYKDNLKIKILDKHSFELWGSNNLYGKYAFGQNIKKSSIGNIRVFLVENRFVAGQEIKVHFTEINQQIEENLKKLEVSLTNQKSTVLKLSYQETLPTRGRDILKKLHEEYTLAALSDKNIEATNTLRFIDERLKLISSELTTVEKDVESYKSAAGFTDIGAEADLFLAKVKETDSKLNEVDVKIKVLEGIEKFLNTPGTNVSSVASLVEEPVLANLIKNLSDLELQKEKYSRTVQVNHPLFETLNTQINNTKSAIRENITNQKKNLVVSRGSLNTLNRGIESSIRRIPKKEREFVSIKRQQEIKENLYLLLLKKKRKLQFLTLLL